MHYKEWCKISVRDTSWLPCEERSLEWLHRGPSCVACRTCSPHNVCSDNQPTLNYTLSDCRQQHLTVTASHTSDNQSTLNYTMHTIGSDNTWLSQLFTQLQSHISTSVKQCFIVQLWLISVMRALTKYSNSLVLLLQNYQRSNFASHARIGLSAVTL